MDDALVRSEGVTEMLTAPVLASGASSWERFEALYRTSRDDVYRYVLTLLRDEVAEQSLLVGKFFSGEITIDARKYYPTDSVTPIHSDFIVI